MMKLWQIFLLLSVVFGGLWGIFYAMIINAPELALGFSFLMTIFGFGSGICIILFIVMLVLRR